MITYKSLPCAVLLLSMLFLVSSCEKLTEDGKAKAIHYNEKSYALTYGTMSSVQVGIDSYDYVVELWDATNLLSDYRGEMHMHYFRINGSSEELWPGTYPLKVTTGPIPSASLIVGTVADPSSVRKYELTHGEIVVERVADYYKFTITLFDAEGKPADGYYEGILVEGDGDSDGGWDWD